MKSFLCVHHNSDATGIIRTLHPTFKLHTRNPFVASMLTEARLMPQRGKRGLCKQVTLRHSLLLFSKRTTLDFLLVHQRIFCWCKEIVLFQNLINVITWCTNIVLLSTCTLDIMKRPLDQWNSKNEN